MQNAHGEWRHFVKRTLSRRMFDNYDLGLRAVEALGYPKVFRERPFIIDAYPGTAVFSAALHNTLRPSKHILVEPFTSFQPWLNHLANETIEVNSDDPFRWGTFTNLVKAHRSLIDTQDRSKIHDQLLYVANLTHRQGEQLVAQYLNCASNQSWLQSFGRVRMLLWMRSSVAEKLLAGPGEDFRHRIGTQRESCCDARVVFHVPQAKKIKNYPRILKEPMLSLDIRKDVLAKIAQPISLVELVPREKQVEHIDEFEYVLKNLFILRSRPLKEALNSLGPGAVEDLSPQLTDLLSKKPTQLTLDDFIRITDVFWKWPFKPDFLMDFYEESVSTGQGAEESSRI